MIDAVLAFSIRQRWLVMIFVLGAAGWAVGSSWHTAKHDLRYLDYVVVAGIVLLAAYLVVRHRRSTTMDRRVSDTPR